MKYSNDITIFFASVFFLLIIGCKSNKDSDKEINKIPYREIPYTDSLGKCDLDYLMAFIRKYEIRPPLFTGWGIVDNHIEVSLILYNEKNIARFKKEVIDHPAIRFDKKPSLKLPLPDCKDCGIEVSISPNTLTDSISQVTMTMTNNSIYQIITGFEYTIFRHTGTEWEHIPFCFAIESLGVLIPPGDSYKFNIDIFTHGYDYPPGRYLITKKAGFEEDEKQINWYVTGAEFVVK